jgi:hypothetical protein
MPAFAGRTLSGTHPAELSSDCRAELGGGSRTSPYIGEGFAQPEHGGCRKRTGRRGHQLSSGRSSSLGATTGIGAGAKPACSNSR